MKYLLSPLAKELGKPLVFPSPFPAGIERGGDSFELSFLRRGNGERRSAKQLWDLLAAEAPESRTAGLVQGCRAFEQAGQPAHYAALYPRLPLSQVPEDHCWLLSCRPRRHVYDRPGHTRRAVDNRPYRLISGLPRTARRAAAKSGAGCIPDLPGLEVSPRAARFRP